MAKDKSKRSARSRRSVLIRNILSTILLLLALSVLFYPIVANYLAGQQAVQSVQNFNQELKATPKSKINKLIDDAKLYNANLYNQYIYDMSQRIPWKGDIPNYDQTLNIDKKGMMGYIDIPQIKVKDVPIYHGDDEATLAIGVGHIQQTSLPVGGINTHTVLVAHSGRVNDTLFTDLDKLKKGDVFYLHTLNLDLKYEVINMRVVVPSDVSTLNIVKGEDLATLVTCYPTGINNKRLLVTGKRIPLSKMTPSEKINRNPFGYNFWVLLGSGILALIGLLSLLLWLLGRRKVFYQAAATELKTPSLASEQTIGEFGPGFYLTTNKKLAEFWAKNLGIEQPVINAYRFRKEKKDLKYLIYYQKTDHWEQFVKNNLAKSYEGKDHDYVKGPHFSPEISVRRRDKQLVLQSESAFDHLKFVKSYSLNEK